MEIDPDNQIKRIHKQFELFGSQDQFSSYFSNDDTLKHTKDTIFNWRNKIHNHQKRILDINNDFYIQKSLIQNEEILEIKKINPFLLKGISVNFWRSNKKIHTGAAMYFVLDTIQNTQIILYIGETNSADTRWKGYHDCKNYINNYKESLAHNNIDNHLDIRFFLDVPKEVRLRRKLEQKLIHLWLPPFNKETRSRWSTTFTNN